MHCIAFVQCICPSCLPEHMVCDSQIIMQRLCHVSTYVSTIADTLSTPVEEHIEEGQHQLACMGRRPIETIIEEAIPEPVASALTNAESPLLPPQRPEHQVDSADFMASHSPRAPS